MEERFLDSQPILDFKKNEEFPAKSSKIAIPVRNYMQKPDDISGNPLEIPLKFQETCKNPTKNRFQSEEVVDSWGSIDEKPIYSVDQWVDTTEDSWGKPFEKGTSEVQSSEDPWNTQEINETPSWPGYNENAFAVSRGENKLKIPQSAYKPRNPEDSKLPEENFGNSRRPRGSRGNRGRFRNFRSSADVPLTTTHVPIPNPVANEIKITPPQLENWPNFVNIVAESSEPEEFNLKTYKTQKCPNGDKCKGCNKYHYEGEKRRDLGKIQYAPVLCPRLLNCQQQDRCGKSHNFMEIYYHPQIYRSHPCPYSQKCKQCALGTYCNLIHILGDKTAESRNKLKCGTCLIEDISMVRVKCGHAFCKNCSVGEWCKKCNVLGDVIKLEL